MDGEMDGKGSSVADLLETEVGECPGGRRTLPPAETWSGIYWVRYVEEV